MSAPQLAAYIEGQGVVGADNLNTFEQTCDTADQLRAFIGLLGMQVFIRGISAIGDGGQGEFYWNPAATGPDDNSDIIQPPGVAIGAWVRIGPGVSDVYMLRNGSNVDMDGEQMAAFRAAIGLKTISLADYGAVGDCVRASVSMNSGSAIMAGTGFTAGMAGKYVLVRGAGPAGAALVATVLSFTSSNSVILSANAGTSVTSATAFYGTNDAAAFTAALEACKAVNNLGVKPALYIPTANYLVTYNPVISDPVIYDAVPAKSFACIQGWANIDDGDEPAAWLTLVGNGSTIVCDGPSNSWFLSGDPSNFVRFHIEGGLEFMASGRQPSQNAVFAYQFVLGHYENPIFTDFNSMGIGLNFGLAERNSIYDLEARNCTTGVRLGAPVAGSRNLYEANENRFYNSNFNGCGADLTDAESLTRGYVEIFYAEAPVFVGGSWKNNLNPLMIGVTRCAIFDGLYFEIPLTNTRTNGFALHVNFNSLIGDLYTNTSAATIFDVAFRNCYFGEFYSILFQAGAFNGFTYNIDTITFDAACKLDDTVAFFFVSGQQASIHRIEVQGRAVLAIPEKPDTSSYPVPATSPPDQFPVTYPAGTLGSLTFTALDVQTVYPGYNGNRTAASFTFDRPLVTAPMTFATLPAAGAAGAGARSFITDCNSTTFHAVAAGGGADSVPVVSDGTNWLVG